MTDWQSQRTMTPRQYALAIAALGLNKGQAGRFLGVSTRTAHRYYDGVTPVPVAHALLLRAMIAHGDIPQVPKWVKE